MHILNTLEPALASCGPGGGADWVQEGAMTKVIGTLKYLLLIGCFLSSMLDNGERLEETSFCRLAFAFTCSYSFLIVHTSLLSKVFISNVLLYIVLRVIFSFKELQNTKTDLKLPLLKTSNGQKCFSCRRA